MPSVVISHAYKGSGWADIGPMIATATEYTLTWTAPSKGEVRFKAVATADDGRVGIAISPYVHIGQRPEVTFTFPIGGEECADSIVSLVVGVEWHDG